MQTSENRPERSRLWTFLKAVLALILISFILSQTNPKELLALRGQIAWEWLWLYVTLYFSLTLLKAYQYKKMLDLPIPFARLVSIVVLQNGLSNIVANSAGIVSYLVMLRGEQGVKTSRAALVFVITKIGDLFAVWVALFIASMFLWNQILVLHATVFMLLLVLGAPLFVFLLVVFLRHRFTGFLSALLEKTRLMHIHFISQSMIGLETLIHEDQGSIFQMTLIAFSLSALYFLITLAWYMVQLRLFSVVLGFMSITFVTTILQLISIIPVTILGGLGVVETSSLYLYTLFGVDPASFAAILIGLRALFYIVNLVVLLYLPIYGFLDKNKS